MKIKVLKLDNYCPHFKKAIESEKEYYNKREVIPTFNRDGWYLTKGCCWIESEGKAYTVDRETFIMDLKVFDACEKPIKTVEGLQHLYKIDKKILSKEQREILYYFSLGRRSKQITRDMKLRFMSFKKKKGLRR